MLACLPDGEIERFIDEDLPYGDLTTHLLGIGTQPGIITFTTREETTLCCCEEAGRVLEKCGCRILTLEPSGTCCAPGTVFLTAMGTAQALHAGWKVALNLLEYASGIASRTARVVKAAKGANPCIAVVTTRKSFPGTKKIAIKAIMAGGALPHRLGLSETVLVFKQHTAFLGGLDALLAGVADLRAKVPENRIIVEADDASEALRIAGAGVDVVQVDKLPPAELRQLVDDIHAMDRAVKISAAGGINEGNVAEYAASGVDIIVLSSVYFGKPADIGARIVPRQP
ncbi:ModD protein [Geobacter sp. AOG2]|uniref:ModD protein n=1 Tax=Geobacter sp. AOG2 TaxID=1566347 RepID=UPI001CC3C59D|nr:ModD protein [Geobacter sp. AOG2]GFE61656.1 ModD protein [Geobacter sp. AOG2]